MSDAFQYAQSNHDRFLDDLLALLRIPSISTDPAYQGDVQRAAEWLRDHMLKLGLTRAEVIPTKGHPIVYGEWLGAGDDAPTVLVYGHYDVQPADKEIDGWATEPFEPVVMDGRIYARGATDDKGQVMVQLAAAESLIQSGTCPVNLKYILEGEEESSSENLPIFVQENLDMLKADLCLISDTGIKAIDQPTLYYGLRGLVAMEVVVSGPKHDLHSGIGGMIHNPAQVIAEMVAALHDETGRVTVPGFYDDVVVPDDDERARLNMGDYSADEWAQIMGDLPEWGEPGYTKAERVGIRPTLEINGIAGGYAGDGFKTVLPAQARAKISCRLVPNQSAEKIYKLVSDHIRAIAPDTVRVEIQSHGLGEPAVTDITHPAIRAAEQAYAYHWDKPMIYERGGGSIPIVSDFQQTLGLPVVLLGFALPDSKVHGPDENFYLEMFHKGIDTVIHFLSNVAETL